MSLRNQIAHRLCALLDDDWSLGKKLYLSEADAIMTLFHNQLEAERALSDRLAESLEDIARRGENSGRDTGWGYYSDGYAAGKIEAGKTARAEGCRWAPNEARTEEGGLGYSWKSPGFSRGEDVKTDIDALPESSRFRD